ncbi:alpha/beta hydrolase [Maricaulis sp.]|uniref:alpha/beta fold hydrolase n=1 Tax=Maricaulis sp. TaxID=1486257 RepID=UPI002B2661D8|nr:alpha/beta hydrolase [Maricaulis sp.]
MKPYGSGKMSIGGWIAIAVAIVVGATAGQADGQGPDPFMAGSVQIERFGSPAGRDVILVPGLATPGEVWAETVAALGDSVDAHVVTLAGFGGVSALERGERGVVGSAVADLAAWIAAENIEDAVLVGHSMGAQIALQLAADAPDQVSAVVVVDSAPFFARLFNPAITEAQAAAYAAGVSAQMAAAPREQFLAMSRQGLPVQSITADGQARVMAWMELADQAVVSQAMGEVMGADFSSVLPQVSVPVTVMYAWSEGAPVSADQLESVYANQYAGLAAVELQRIEGSRHFIMLDQPAVFRTALGAVIARPDGED